MKKILILICLIFLTSCQPATPRTDGQTDEGNAGLANPASVNCEQKGGTLEIRKNESGEYGVCKFADGSECEEWAYFRGECKEGSVKSGDPAGISNFDDCVKAGNPVMESYPRQCKMPDGKSFTEDLSGKTTSDTACPETFNPVCAKIQVQCIKAPCPPVIETIDNECLANARGTLLKGYVGGQCEKDLGTTCKEDSDCKLPGEYAAMSRCPFESRCVIDTCVVICPTSHAVK